MINVGNNTISKVYLGNLEIKKVYKGNLIIYPYDAEIEYLRSTGSQYINTEISANQIIKAQIKFSFNSSLSSINSIMGASRGTAARNYAYISSASKFMCSGQSSTSIASNTQLQPNTIYTLNITFNNLSTTEHYALFARCVENSNRVIGNMNIHSAKFFNNDNDLLFDGIAVKKNNIGYIYDKVSGELFGNSGTGNFILGPDIT